MRCEENGNQDEGEEMIVLGRIIFGEDAMHRFVRQSWNPSRISAEQRKQIADVLSVISERLRKDEFEDNGEYKKFPASWTQE